jgi:hypothetical protein
MQVSVSDRKINITVDLAELCTLDCALGAFLSQAANPRHPGERVAELDAERADIMERVLFKTYCTLTEKRENNFRVNPAGYVLV